MPEKEVKIIHISPNLNIGGAERLVQDICSYIFKNKLAEVKLITFHKDVEIKYPFHINIISEFKPSIISKSTKNVYELQCFINEFNPDIIHSHLWETEMLLTNIVHKYSIRFSHFHDNIIQLKKKLIPKTKNQITNIYERMLFNKDMNNHFICIAKDSLEYALKNLPNKNRIHLIPNAIDFQKFHYTYKRDFDEIKIITIGSFVNKKNQSLAVHILKTILNNGFSAKLTFLGEGELKEDVKTLSETLGISNRIDFLGNVENVERKLEKSNFYLHTATYEPFGLVLLEAMAAGLPVVSLDGKGNRDFIKHKENGYIFKKQDPEIFAETIINLFENQKLYDKISKNGQNTARGFDIKNYVKNLLSLYNESMSLINSA